MKLRGLVVRRNHISYSCLAAVLLVAAGAPTYAQQSVVSDWSTHHVKFTSPGTEMNALMNGHRQTWQNYLSNPRYQWQQNKRSAAWANRLSTHTSDFWDSRGNREPNSKNSSLQGLWTSSIAPAGNGTPQDMYPAEYDANFSTPSCTGDYIEFPVNANGSATQPNLVVFDNLYTTAAGKGTCSGTGPTVKAAYYVETVDDFETYTVQTSPSPSEDGTQVAFVTTPTSGFGNSYLYVLTLGTSGTVAAPKGLTTTANGDGLTYKVLEFDNPAGGFTSVSDTISSPYIDYTNNTAYVGDSSGYLHKFTGVFGASTLAEDTTAPWPYQPTGGTATLTSPVVDPQTGDVLVGASNGDVYCVTAAGVSCGSFSVTNGTGTGVTLGAVYDSPVVVDNGNTTGTTGWVFAQAAYQTATTVDGTHTTKGTASTVSDAILAQALLTPTGTSTVTRVNVGTVTVSATATTDDDTPTIALTTPNLYDGDFDNTYYNSTVGAYTGGHMYACGNETATPANDGTNGTDTYHATPELYEIGFAASGTITGSATAIYTPAGNTTAEASGCTPLTEFYNANANSGAGVDYLFLGVSGYGTPNGSGGTPNCDGDGCVMNFELPTGGLAVGTAPTAAYSLGGNVYGSSGIVIDNQSTDTGASQIYFSNIQTGNATAASQAGLD